MLQALEALLDHTQSSISNDFLEGLAVLLLRLSLDPGLWDTTTVRPALASVLGAIPAASWVDMVRRGRTVILE